MSVSDKDSPKPPTIIIGGNAGAIGSTNGTVSSILSAAERRTADRIPYEVAAKLTQGENIVHAKTENVSASGAFFGVPHLLAVGSSVHVSFELPGGPFECSATIMRIRPTGDRGPGIGLMFHDVADKHRMILEKLCPPAKAIVRHSPG